MVLGNKKNLPSPVQEFSPQMISGDAPLVLPAEPQQGKEALKWYHHYDEDIQRIIEKWDKKLTPYGRDRIQELLDIFLSKNTFMSFLPKEEFNRVMLNIGVEIYYFIVPEHRKFGLNVTEAVHLSNLLIQMIDIALRRAIGGRERDLTFKSYQHVIHQDILSEEEEGGERKGFLSKLFGGGK